MLLQTSFSCHMSQFSCFHRIFNEKVNPELSVLVIKFEMKSYWGKEWIFIRFLWASCVTGFMSHVFHIRRCPDCWWKFNNPNPRLGVLCCCLIRSCCVRFELVGSVEVANVVIHLWKTGACLLLRLPMGVLVFSSNVWVHTKWALRKWNPIRKCVLINGALGGLVSCKHIMEYCLDMQTIASIQNTYIFKCI